MTPEYRLPEIEVVDGVKQIALPDYPVVFYALGDAPGAILTQEANDLMVQLLEALEHPQAPEMRRRLGLDPDEIAESGESNRYALYDDLEVILDEVTPPGFAPVRGGYVIDEGSWYGWQPTNRT